LFLLPYSYNKSTPKPQYTFDATMVIFIKFTDEAP
jgi:hypothetical protein